MVSICYRKRFGVDGQFQVARGVEFEAFDGFVEGEARPVVKVSQGALADAFPGVPNDYDAW
jgi:hypothetical protein